MKVMLPRSPSTSTVDELLAGLALREPSIDSTSDDTAVGAEDEQEVDVEALSDQDSQQLQEPLAAVELLQSLAEQLAELLEPFRASRHAPSAPVARKAHEVVSQYCKVVRQARRLQGATATLEMYSRLACPLLEAAELLLEAGELALLDSAMGIRANAGALHMVRLLLDCFESHPLLEINDAMEDLMCQLVTRGHALRSLVTLLVAAYPEGHDREEGCTLVAAVYGMFCSLVAGDGEALQELEGMGLKHVLLQNAATECYSTRISDEAVLESLDEEYGSWLRQQATSCSVVLPGAAGEVATKLVTMTGVLALLRCSEPLSALWSRHLAGTEQGLPGPSTRWNKMLLKLALSVYLRRVQRFHHASRKGHAAMPRYDLMPLAPSSCIRLEFKADRAEALYRDATEAIDAAINAPDEPQTPAGSTPRGPTQADAPAGDTTPCMPAGNYTAGSGSYLETQCGAARGGRAPRTPRTSAKAHHHHSNSGGGMSSVKSKSGRKKR